ncbi:ParB/RepB/Spo0J family partition protein [Streptomyces abyssomicinicus]|uniref:ParB/RepB/Spo0J family partition protein n=1 Tax=Streptomyces abyssomicinicus TaxID=574929 RepID=UPI001FE55CFA|nr:ParB/RepB/Spo0J family partition protein [Streptomyces abyssomicinicus]
MAAKKKDWNELLGGGTNAAGTNSTADVASDKPAEPPTTVFMHTIVGNPDNPRPEDDYSDSDSDFRELKASMKEIGQLQPLAVVSREIFEKAKPEAVAAAPPKVRKLIRNADWVVVTGNRRLAAARQLGWTRIDIRVQDHLGDEEGRLDEAVIIENIHRKNLAPVREAQYLQRMLERHGSQEKVAERIGKSQMFVSQRLALLNLAPDIQEQVNMGTLKIKEARQVARTPDHEEQRARVADLQARAAEPKQPQNTAVVQNPVLKPGSVGPVGEGGVAVASGVGGVAGAVVQNPVLKPGSVGPVGEGGVAVASGVGGPTGAVVQNPVLKTAPELASDAPHASAAVSPQEAIPEPRTHAGDEEDGDGRPRRLPYDDPGYVVRHLHLKMETPFFVRGGRLWLQILRAEHPEEYRAVLAELGLREEPSA